MLTDEVTIRVEAGKGGDGLISFHRERFVPKGGPDGGDGGNGGDVIIKVNPSVNTLTFFNMRKKFEAENGENGKKAKCHGKNGKDLILEVPPGTIVWEIPNIKNQISNKFQISKTKFQKVTDLINIGQEIIVVRGGKGGWGNVHFASSTNQTPKQANSGTPGEKKEICLELQMIADVGLIGKPNAGKSTLLSRISQARPKIANYPFTTLEPNLGVVRVDDKFSFTAADIPGLIKGASKGKGLGYKFLRHIKRTRLLVHLIDCMSNDPMDDYNTIRNELKEFSLKLAHKPEIVIITKVDTMSEKEQRRFFAKVSKLKPFFISTVTGRGISDLLYEIKKRLKK